MGAIKAFEPMKLAPDATLSTLIDWCRQIQDRLGATLSPVSKLPVLDGVLLERVRLTGGAVTQVGHGLNRAWRGFIVTRRRDNVTVWDDTDQSMPERVIRLAASGDCIIDLWVF